MIRKGSQELYECHGCGALFGTFDNLTDSYARVGFGWCRCPGQKAESGMIESRYFDFSGVGGHAEARGAYRRHGWYHPFCKGITQVG
jgi:hypothetical protein